MSRGVGEGCNSSSTHVVGTTADDGEVVVGLAVRLGAASTRAYSSRDEIAHRHAIHGSLTVSAGAIAAVVEAEATGHREFVTERCDQSQQSLGR